MNKKIENLYFILQNKNGANLQRRYYYGYLNLIKISIKWVNYVDIFYNLIFKKLQFFTIETKKRKNYFFLF